MTEIEKYDRLVTRHLILRKATMKDLDLMWKNIWTSEDMARRMLWDTVATRAEAIRRLRKLLQYQQEQFWYLVCLRSTNEPIGTAEVRPLIDYGLDDSNCYEEFGICVTEKYQSNGYGKEILQTLKRLVFVKLGGDIFYYKCESDNDKSRNLALMQNFRFEKIRKEYYDDKEVLIIDYYMTRQMYRRELQNRYSLKYV